MLHIHTHTHTEIKHREREKKRDKVNVVKWEIWVKGIQEFLVYTGNSFVNLKLCQNEESI